MNVLKPISGWANFQLILRAGLSWTQLEHWPTLKAQSGHIVVLPSSHNQVEIWLRPLGNAAYVACLTLLCQGSEWLNGKSV